MRHINLMRPVVAAMIAVGLAIAITPSSFAAAPGPGQVNLPTGAVGAAGAYGQPAPNATWLAKKNAHLLRSGVSRQGGKGTGTAPYFVSGAAAPLSFPSSEVLNYNNAVQTTFEPSDGNNPNYGSGTVNTDDGYHNYNDHDFFFLCGPAAADIALWYWPYPPNFMNNASVADTALPTPTTWNSHDQDGVARMRGYMTYLAWQINWPGAPHPGMMDNAHYWSYGTTLYGMQDALNWAASGDNTSTWQNYFYVIQWNGSNGPGTGGVSAGVLQFDVMDDIYYSNVPVVAEVNAQLLPNWNNDGTDTHHLITIIGYDNNAGIYYYTDTCANSTACGSNFDGGVRTAPQSTMYNAIMYIAQNQSTDPSGGDGGWVW